MTLCVHRRDGPYGRLYRWPPAGVFEFCFELVLANANFKGAGQRPAVRKPNPANTCSMATLY